MKNNGFTLIELVIFIILIGISVGVMLPLITILANVGAIDHTAMATDLAQQRMELIIAQRYLNGFDYFIAGNNFDPCLVTYTSPDTTPAVCTPPNGYTITTSLSTSWGGDTNYRAATVTVSGKGSATMETVFARY